MEKPFLKTLRKAVKGMTVILVFPKPDSWYEDISLAYQGSYVLIGVAGMEYAVHVEAKGKDVATTGYIQCQEYLRKALIRVFEKI
ncbi:hypothetical protein NXW38_25530 [Bacteroides ovatus]|nr:hypothetical protein [Bacteroides ovatus]